MKIRLEATDDFGSKKKGLNDQIQQIWNDAILGHEGPKSPRVSSEMN